MKAIVQCEHHEEYAQVKKQGEDLSEGKIMADREKIKVMVDREKILMHGDAVPHPGPRHRRRVQFHTH